MQKVLAIRHDSHGQHYCARVQVCPWVEQAILHKRDFPNYMVWVHLGKPKLTLICLLQIKTRDFFYRNTLASVQVLYKQVFPNSGPPPK